MMKRFRVNSITRDKEYDLTKGIKDLNCFFAASKRRKRNIAVLLRPRPHLKKLRFDIDLGDLLIGVEEQLETGVTKEIVQKVVQKK